MRFVLLHLLVFWKTVATLAVAEKTILPWNATEVPGNETEESESFFTISETDSSEEETVKIPDDLQRGRKLEDRNAAIDEVCGAPPLVANAFHSGSKQGSFPIRSVVTYTCEFGYVATGSKRSSSCVVSYVTQQTEWTRVQLKCSPRSCGDPGYVSNGRIVGSLFTFPHNVSIECDDGFERRGQRLRFCQANGEWSGSLPTCERIMCPVPASPLNGRTIYSSLEYGSELKYQCEKGFKLDRKESRLCDQTGRWSGIEPTCSEMHCDPPVAPDHGSVQILDEGLKPGSLIVYACNEERTLVGSPRTTCSADGQWIFPAPRCVVPCVVPRISNAVMGKYGEENWRLHFRKSRVQSKVSENEVQVIRCDPGYFIAGKNSVEAQISCLDGKWSENLTCVSSRCGKVPPETKNAYIYTKNDHHSGTITYICETLFKKTQTGNVTCLFGQWEGITPVCEKKDCLVHELGDPGLEDSPRIYRNGHSFDPSCRTGYETSMIANKLICREGNWTGYIPPCQPASCRKDPPIVSNARAIPDCRTHECTVTYNCEPSFTQNGNSTVRCHYGSWVGEPATCRSEKCHVPRIVNGEIGRYDIDYYSRKMYKKSRPGDEMHVGVEYHLRCNRNYHVAGGRTNEIKAFCSNGAFSELLQCVSSSCGEEPPPTENAFIIYKSYRHGGTVTYHCNDNYEKEKIGNVTCLFGHWEGSNPICRAIGASTLSLVTEKELTVLPDDQLEPSSTAPVSTEAIELRSECTCQYSTNDQHLLAYVSDKKIKSGSKISQGSTVTFGCENFGSLKLIGQPKVVCASCGLTIQPPKCEYPVEGDTEVHFGGDFVEAGINLLEVKRGGNLRFICYARTINKHYYPVWVMPSEHNYKIMYGNPYDTYLHTILEIRSLSEQNSGQYTCYGRNLTSTMLNVRVVEPKPSCPSLPRSAKYTIRYEGDRAYFYCNNENQDLIGDGILQCDPSGRWSGEPPDCTDVECPELIESINLKIYLTDGKKMGSTATFFCFSPLQLKGNTSLSCLRNGTWSAQTPTCVLPNCSVDGLYSLMPEFMYPVMENVDGETVPFGSNFTLQCEDDHQITKPARATCGAEGKWTIPSVGCISGCVPFAKNSGSVLIVEPQQNFYRLGEQIWLSCPPGLELTRNIEVVMCFGGKWSEVDIPDCQ